MKRSLNETVENFLCENALSQSTWLGSIGIVGLVISESLRDFVRGFCALGVAAGLPLAGGLGSPIPAASVVASR